MQANELRRKFIDFFTSRDHLYIGSASLIPHDQTLLFTNSGMVPFKNYFLGDEKPPAVRAVSVQKCVRAGGKHNDLDEVGRTKRHLTFFEMMGNFSFGDYFKEQAIPQAWEFSTKELGLDPDRLWVTVHLTDDEAEEIWHNQVGVPRERIQRLDEDNWWRMADTGPNGPCSEIFWDKGPEYGPEGGPANPEAEERYIEIWNLVFMQFETDAEGNSTPLPKPSIDTGAGLERVLSVLQGKDSVFEIDEMARLVDVASAITGYEIGADENSDLALRVLAEHARTMTFLISDGVFPSNEDRGYVLRRIMRRAVRFAYLLGVTELVTPRLTQAVVDIMAEDYPQLGATADLVQNVVTREETQFRRTLAKGLGILGEKLEGLPQGSELDGSVAFLLHDTYGFPYEVTAEVASERGFTVDRAGFDADMADQRKRAKEARSDATAAVDIEAVQALLETAGLTEFVGRDELEDVDAEIVLVTQMGTPGASIFLNRTPFYAESGGQVGDTGLLSAVDAKGATVGEAVVTNTLYAVPGIHRHKVEVTSGTFEPGMAVKATVHAARRAGIARNHTGTHILHWALRQRLGDHVQQQGSLVAPDRLRFDFSHFDSLTAADIDFIEDLANAAVLSNVATEHPEVTKDEAEEMGAIAFFGDKYGELVRVLRAGPSLEFCGGTHVGALGDIGPIKIVSEGSIGSNIRRIEAITGTGPIALLRAEQAETAALAEVLGVPRSELRAGVAKRLAELEQANREIKSLRAQVAASRASELVAGAVDGKVVVQVDGLDRDAMKSLALASRDAAGVTAVVLGGVPEGGGAALVAATTPEAGVDASDLIAAGAKAIQGGGGKGKDLAMAGGKNGDGVPEALDEARKVLGIS
jgi:alanyl-tRNA synthetase